MLRRTSSVFTCALALLPPLLGAAPASAATGYVTADVAAIDVGDVPAGAKAARTVTLTATTSVSYNGVGIGGMAPMEWAVTGDTCTGTIRAAAETCHFTVEFTAGAVGVFPRDLSVSYNGPGTAYGITIPLSATVPASTTVTVGDTISGPDATNNDYRLTGGPFRAAQAFTATQSGILTSASALVSAYDGCADTSICSGLPSLKVDLLADGPGATLATTTIPRSSVPAGLGSTITARFTNPPHVVAGQRYLIALSASGATPPYSEYRWWASKTGGNQPYYVTSSSSSSWEQVLNGTPVRQASATIAVFTDTTAPVAVIDSQPAGSTASTSASLAFHATDDRTGASQLAYSCRLDDNPWAACASPASYPDLAYGAHTVTVRATDEAGNTGTATATWTVQDVPGSPTGLSATAGDHSATVSWTAAPANGSAVSGYSVTATPGGAEATVGGDVTTATMSGLANGTAYTFTVHANNALGAGPLSAPSPAVTPATVPAAPQAVTATPGDQQSVVSWQPPAEDGGSPITGYRVTATPGGVSTSVPGSATTATLEGLDYGTTYTFAVTATNTLGTSTEAVSNAVRTEGGGGAGRLVGGVLKADTLWLATAGTYTVTSTVQIPSGRRLLLAPGATVTAAASPMFLVNGLLRASGTAASPVTLDGNGSADFFSTKNAPGSAGVEISHAAISHGASLMPATGWAQYAYLRLSDSHIDDVPGYSYLYYPEQDDVVERNVFSNSGGFSVGSSAGHIYVCNNRFRTASTTGYWVRDWAGYNGPATVTGNTFEAAGTPTVDLEPGQANAALDARGNYWGTTDPALIERMVYDNNDDITTAGAIATDPILDTDDDAVPHAEPAAPGQVTAVAGDRSATVTWTAPGTDGGSAVTGYTVTAHPGGTSSTVDGSSTSAVLAGLANGTAYTFTVTAVNAVGSSPASAASSAVTPAGVPDAPGQVTAVAGDRSVTVSWTAAAANGAAVTGYTVTASPGGTSVVVDGSSTSAVVAGLANGTAYTFTVTAVNAVGPSPASAASSAVTPQDPDKPTMTSVTGPAAVTRSTSAQFSFGAADVSDPAATLVYRCSLDGAAFSACASPTSYAGLGSTVHSFAVKAADPSGNESATVSRTWRVDTTAPSLTVTAPTATFTLATSLVPAWATTDAGAGVASADLRWQRAPFNGTFGAWVYPSSWQGTTATRASLAASRGYTYCVSGRARDKAGNVSAWSAPRCTAVALDDRSLSASAGWSRTTSSSFYAGTATVTSRSSVSLTRTGVQARRIALVATRCSTCGTVGVYWNGVLVKKVSLYASSTQRRALIGVTSFTSVRSGTLTIRSLTSGKGIQVDGVALDRA